MDAVRWFFQRGESLLDRGDRTEAIYLEVVEKILVREPVEWLEIDGSGEVDEAVQGIGQLKRVRILCVEGLDGNAEGFELIRATGCRDQIVAL